MVTSGTTTVAYLAEHHPDARLVVGERGLRSQLAGAGLPVTDDPDAAEVVVASIDRSFTFDTLADVTDLLPDRPSS